MPLVLKTSKPSGFVGSNPTASANLESTANGEANGFENRGSLRGWPFNSATLLHVVGWTPSGRHPVCKIGAPWSIAGSNPAQPTRTYTSVLYQRMILRKSLSRKQIA